MNKKYFITLNPHHINLSYRILLKDIREALVKYYRKKLGRCFNKKKEEQYPIYLFLEYANKNETHFHIITETPTNEIDNLYAFIISILKKKYLSMTTDIRLIDEMNGLLQYLTKEKDDIHIRQIFSNEELYTL